MTAYSFKDILCSYTGPFGSLDLSENAGSADEGITITYDEDKATKTMGAGGEGMYSLHASEGGGCSVRFLKVSPINAMLNQMYSLETSSSAYYGRGVLTVRDSIRGDNWVLKGVGFRKHPDGAYTKDGPVMMEWTFHVLKIDAVLGDGNSIAAFSLVA
jgi:hypothetical protein